MQLLNFLCTTRLKGFLKRIFINGIINSFLSSNIIIFVSQINAGLTVSWITLSSGRKCEAKTNNHATQLTSIAHVTSKLSSNCADFNFSFINFTQNKKFREGKITRKNSFKLLEKRSK